VPSGTIFFTDAMNDEAASAVFGFFTRLSESTTFAEVKVVLVGEVKVEDHLQV